MVKCKVENVKNNKGSSVKNQIIITNDDGQYFQSYNSIIAFKSNENDVILDKTYWNYSNTTSKYLSLFLKEPTKRIREKLNTGGYILDNLN